MNREDRRTLKHAAKLLRTEARVIQSCHQDSDGVIDSINIARELKNFLSTANRLREIARRGQ